MSFKETMVISIGVLEVIATIIYFGDEKFKLHVNGNTTVLKSRVIGGHADFLDTLVIWFERGLDRENFSKSNLKREMLG